MLGTLRRCGDYTHFRYGEEPSISARMRNWQRRATHHEQGTQKRAMIVRDTLEGKICLSLGNPGGGGGVAREAAPVFHACSTVYNMPKGHQPNISPRRDGALYCSHRRNDRPIAPFFFCQRKKGGWQSCFYHYPIIDCNPRVLRPLSTSYK